MQRVTFKPASKLCRRCNQTKLAEEFSPTGREFGLSSLTSWCKSCMKEVKNLYWASPKGQQCRRGVNLKRHHGMTVERYDEMFAGQSGKCLICGEPPEEGKHLYVDHDHETGVRRDLLCRRCNLVLGIVGEDVVLLGALIGYIMKHRGLLEGLCGIKSGTGSQQESPLTQSSSSSSS